MGIFGWDLPPGVGPGDLPGEQEQASDLLPYLNDSAYSEAWWLEDGGIEIRLTGQDGYGLYETFDWNDNLSDEDNFKAAAAYIKTLAKQEPPCQS